MLEDTSFALTILQNLDFAILLRIGPMQYRFFGKQPDFYKQMFPPDEMGNPCVTPWDYSAMLDFFINDVENHFIGGIPGSLASGIWQEEGIGETELPLMATALRIDGQDVLIIRNFNYDFPNHTTILQKARENLLAQKRLTRSLDFYKKKSSYDALTNLYNKETFLEIIQIEVTQNYFSASPMSILMVDIDNFKQINDTYGHLEGDKVLSTMGEIFKTFLRKNDIAARYGGEEFIIFAPNTLLKHAGFLAEKLRICVAGYRFDIPPITVSIGGAEYTPGEDIFNCIRRADAALYKAKSAGKNTVCLLAEGAYP